VLQPLLQRPPDAVCVSLATQLVTSILRQALRGKPLLTTAIAVLPGVRYAPQRVSAPREARLSALAAALLPSAVQLYATSVPLAGSPRSAHPAASLARHASHAVATASPKRARAKAHAGIGKLK
jgi:hypothetical protein